MCPEKGAELGKVLEHSSNEEKLEEVGLFSLEKRDLQQIILSCRHPLCS